MYAPYSISSAPSPIPPAPTQVHEAPVRLGAEALDDALSLLARDRGGLRALQGDLAKELPGRKHRVIGLLVGGHDIDTAAALVAAGESDPDPALEARELAAFTLTAAVLLNLDETITRD